LVTQIDKRIILLLNLNKKDEFFNSLKTKFEYLPNKIKAKLSMLEILKNNLFLIDIVTSDM
jgi:hypothetical protein